MRKTKLNRVLMLFLQCSKKRGISTIVATVLVILITVASVTILWAGVYPLIQQTFFIEDVNVQVKIDRSEYTQYDSENELLSVRVSRGSDEADIVGIKFIVDDAGNSFSHVTYDVVEPNSAKVYYFSTYDLNSVGEVSVVPIYNVNGGEKESEIKNSLEKVPKSDLSEVERKFIGFGYPEYEGLVAYYPFTNDGKDYSGNGNNGSLESGALINNDGELVLDGDVSYVSIPESTFPALEYTGGDLSFSMWIYSNFGKDTEIISKPWNSCGDYNYKVWYKSNGKISFDVARDDNNGILDDSFRGTTDNSASLNEWHHIVVSLDSSRKMLIFIDSVEGFSGVHTVTRWDPICSNVGVPDDSNIQLVIGTLYPGNSDYVFNGSIDEVMMFDRVLSEAEIKEIYESQKK